MTVNLDKLAKLFDDLEACEIVAQIPVIIRQAIGDDLYEEQTAEIRRLLEIEHARTGASYEVLGQRFAELAHRDGASLGALLVLGAAADLIVGDPS